MGNGPSDYRQNYFDNNCANLLCWHKCHLCNGGVRERDMHVDHVWPKSKGGPNWSWNLRAAHSNCNQSKGNKWLW